ncbi:methionyl-tRNA formyltransferase [Salinarchaeum sp. Harcht-Bsk1]|nr:methionyl-tRNA formyltransferase [Salinarchaeum sp. Harcht-Bsk1]
MALLTPGPTLPAWAATAVQTMIDETDAEIALVVQDGSSDDRGAVETVRRLVELREWGLVAGSRELFGDDLDHQSRTPVTAIDGLVEAERFVCEPRQVDGWKHALPSRAVDRLGATDVAVRMGFGFLVGDALTAPTHGVLSYHHGDFREYRGQPAGFWEYVHGRDIAGVTLQRINETLDGGEVVAERDVVIADAPTWDEVRRRLFDASTDLLAEGVTRLERESFEPERLSQEELGDLYSLPRGRPVLTYLEKSVRGKLRRWESLGEKGQ